MPGNSQTDVAPETVQAAEPPVLDRDPYSYDVLTNPYPFHEELRKAAPVVWLRPYGIYATGRHAEAVEILSDFSRFTSLGGVGIQDIRKPGDFRIPNRLNEADPPAHTQLRGVLSRLLSPIVIRGWREQFETEAKLLAQELKERREFDGVSDVAETFVLRAFQKAVGIDLPRANTLAISGMRFNQVGPSNEFYHRAMQSAQPYLEWFDKSTRREFVRPGSIGELLYACEDRGEIEEGVAANMLRTFVGGGTDSTITAIGHALHLLARHPDQWALLRQDPGKAKAAFEEALRMEAPFQMIYRTTTRETALSGVRLDADMKIGVFLGAANRDPQKWTDPDRFDLTRDSAGIHISFGHGIHICIGQMIARLESEAILNALAATFSTLELGGQPRFRPVNQMRQLEFLPLHVA